MKLQLKNLTIALAITLVAGLITTTPMTATASNSLVSKFQAQSPKSVYIPANQPVPAQGSSVTLSFDRSDFTGTNADSNYNSALSMGLTATVSYVIADLGYVSYPNVGSIANADDLGYLVILDFGSGQPFSYAYVGYFSFSQAATSIDATGVKGLYSFVDAGVNYLWVPSSISVSSVSGVLNARQFVSRVSVTAVSSSVTLDCTKVNSMHNSSCSALVDKVGSSLTLAAAPNGPVGPSDFVGLAGIQSQIQNGLVQSSLVQLPSAQSQNQQPNKQSEKYEGPEFLGLSAKPVAPNSNPKIQGKKLDEITSLIIAGKPVSFSATADSLVLKLPAGLAPGLYDLVIESSSGKLTHLDAIRVREPLKAFSMTTKSQGRISEEQLLEHFYISKIQDPDLNKVRCVVNSKSKEQALIDAKRLCSLVRGGNPSIIETVIEAKSTVKGNASYARVVYGWTE